jgi:hypothetical protein
MSKIRIAYRAVQAVLRSWTSSFVRSFKKAWHKHILVATALLIAAVLLTSVVSKLWRSRDIGSDSWFARVKGNGSNLDRGAVTSAGIDQLGDHYSKVIYLPQGWSAAQTMWFYNTSQGSDLMPYDFFLVLEKIRSTEAFRSAANMDSYRYLPQQASVSNPDGLPVGFVKDSYKGKDYVGLTCAACHTGQINYRGTAIRVDGAPAMADMDTFLHDLGLNVCNVQASPDVHDRFVSNVVKLGHYSKAAQIDKDLDKTCQILTLYNAINKTDTAYGYARLDAFGRIYNRVLQHILTSQELDEEYDRMTKELVAQNKMNPLNASSVDSVAHKHIIEDEDREDLIDKLAKLINGDIQSPLINQLFPTPDAPVSYPFLWDVPQHDYLQWNGIASNAGLGPIGRNAGEVIGVFGTLDWHQKEGFSLSAVISGQGFHTKHTSFDSSIRVQNLRLIEGQLAHLESPQWPAILGPIDLESSRRGELIFEKKCDSCHTRIQRDDPKRRIVASMASLTEIGTDPRMATNGVERVGYSGILRNEYVAAGPGQVLLNEKAPAGELLTKATLSAVATPEDENLVFRGYDWAYNLIASFFGNEIQPSLKQGKYDPDTTANPYASLYAYKGRSLNGIWATAPYLHNGSIPTLYDLLLPKRGVASPANGEYRPDNFQVGSREFDPKKVGFVSNGYAGFTFDTSKPGNSNAGHNYGTDLSARDRSDLLEYLKTL